MADAGNGPSELGLKFNKKYLTVTDLTKQLWCEQQTSYEFTEPVVYEENAAMTAGSNLHLARELEVQTIQQVDVTCSEDAWAVKILNLVGAISSILQGSPVRRELPIFGAPFGCGVFLVGIIDEIRVDLDNYVFDIIEFKTRRSNKMPSKSQANMHTLQVMLYKKMYDDIVCGKTTKSTIIGHLKLDVQKQLGEGVLAVLQHLHCTCLDQLLDHLFEVFQMVPFISQMLIEYCYQQDSTTIGITSAAYDEAWLEATFKHLVSFWRGSRPPVGVDIEEAWKCDSCAFENDCAWRKKKIEECRQKNAKNFGTASH